MTKNINEMNKGENMIKRTMIIFAALLVLAACETGNIKKDTVEKQSNGGQCVTSEQCKSGSECVGNICVAVEKDEVEGCLSFEDCEEGEMCELETGECVAKDEEGDDSGKGGGTIKKTVVTLKDKTITVTCGEKVINKISAKCTSGACSDWTFEPELPNGFTSKGSGQNLEISGDVSFNECKDSEDKVIKMTACDSKDSAKCATADLTLKFKTKELSVDTGSIDDATVGKSFSFVLAAKGGGGDYTWKDVSATKLCEKFSSADCDTTFKKLPDGLTINGNTISGTATTTGTCHVMLEVTDKITGDKAYSQQIDMKVLDENDVSITLKLVDSEGAETGAGTGDITVPFKSTLMAKIGNSDYYKAEVSPSDMLKVVGYGDGAYAIEPKNDVTEANGVSFTVKNHAGQEKSINISKITFGSDPCGEPITVTLKNAKISLAGGKTRPFGEDISFTKEAAQATVKRYVADETILADIEITGGSGNVQIIDDSGSDLIQTNEGGDRFIEIDMTASENAFSLTVTDDACKANEFKAKIDFKDSCVYDSVSDQQPKIYIKMHHSSGDAEDASMRISIRDATWTKYGWDQLYVLAETDWIDVDKNNNDNIDMNPEQELNIYKFDGKCLTDVDIVEIELKDECGDNNIFCEDADLYYNDVKIEFKSSATGITYYNSWTCQKDKCGIEVEDKSWFGRYELSGWTTKDPAPNAKDDWKN